MNALVWLAASEALAAFVAARLLDRSTFPAYLALYALMCACWLASSYLALRAKGGNAALVLAVAAMLRAPFLFTDPVLSDDVFRYVWDGRVQWAGTNPYLYAPDDPELEGVREEIPEIYAGINNKDVPTLYPPLMQALVLLSTSVFPSVFWMKAIFVLLDLVLVFALTRLLSPLRAIVYAWSPLVVVEIAGSGHNDVAAVLLLVLALSAFERGGKTAPAALAAASGLAKLGGFGVLPFFTRFSPRAIAAAAVAAVAAVLPYASAGEAAFRGLREYGKRWRWNDSLFHVLFALTGDLSRAKVLAASMVALLALALFFRKTPPLRASFLLVGAVLLLAPTVHPWYLLWIAPLLAAYPHPAWLFLQASSVLSYHAFYLTSSGEPWQEMLPMKLLEYGPFFILLGLDWALHGSRKAAQDPGLGRAR